MKFSLHGIFIVIFLVWSSAQAECNEPLSRSLQATSNISFGKKIFYFVYEVDRQVGKIDCHYLSVYDRKPRVTSKGEVNIGPIFFYGALMNELRFSKVANRLVVRSLTYDWVSNKEYLALTAEQHYYFTHNRFVNLAELGESYYAYQSNIAKLKKMLQTGNLKKANNLLANFTRKVKFEDNAYSEYILNFKSDLIMHVTKKVLEYYRQSPMIASKWWAQLRYLNINSGIYNKKSIDEFCKKKWCFSICVSEIERCKNPHRILGSVKMTRVLSDLGYALYKLGKFDSAIQVLSKVQNNDDIRLADVLWKRNKGSDRRKAGRLYGKYYAYKFYKKEQHRIPRRVKVRKKFPILYGDPSY